MLAAGGWAAVEVSKSIDLADGAAAAGAEVGAAADAFEADASNAAGAFVEADVFIEEDESSVAVGAAAACRFLWAVLGTSIARYFFADFVVGSIFKARL